MEDKNRNDKVPLISKIAYGFGDVGCNFSWMFVSNFLMIFYTDVFGISMAAVSGLMLFSRFWDAINDPIIGALTDKTKTLLGTSRLVQYSKNYLYDFYILPAGIRLYLCQHSIWHTVRRNDTKH